MTENRPPFIYRGGGMMLHSPFRQDDSRMFGFFVKGKIDHLQRLCDQCLNAVVTDDSVFRPMMNHVMVTFTHIGKDYSTDPRDKDKGWGKEIDTSIWIPVGKFIKDEKGDEQLDYLYWFVPYIWVDHPMTVLNGREIFGYPKYMAEFEMPLSPKDADYFSVSVNAFKTYSPETQAELHPLFHVKKTAERQPLSERFESFTDMTGQLLNSLKSRDDFDLPSWNFADQLLDGFKQPNIDQLFLKQFPDGKGEKAVYQALTHSPAVIDCIHDGGLLKGDYELTLESFDQIPMARDLGLELGTQEVALGFWIHFDFTIEPARELYNNTQAKPEKIAVLGGGVSAMTSAFALTEDPNWRSKYDITLYQMGWRVGGKGASGRNPALGQRIEEHGLHIWFGFYQNAFEVMQKAYKAMERPKDAPLATWEDAFKKQSFINLQEHVDGKWRNWAIDFPEDNDVPGGNRESVDIWQIAEKMMLWLFDSLKDGIRHLFKKPKYDDVSMWELIPKGLLALGKYFFKWRLLGFRRHLRQKNARNRDIEDHQKEANLLVSMRADVARTFDKLLDRDDDIRRMFIILDFGLTAFKGMLEDGVFKHGYDVINDLDFRDWLRKHGASEKYTVNSSLVRGLYDLVFAFVDGNVDNPQIEAGTCLRGALRIAFCYDGAVMWKMQAGMGDVVFTPLYEVLKKRGVKFKFFHKLEQMTPDVWGSSVEALTFTQQVNLKNPDAEYQPLVNVKDLDCWPSDPLYEQIEASQAELLQANHINLESNWNNWPELYQQATGNALPTVTLKRGKDFDKVIFGLSVGSLPVVAQPLLDLSEPLAKTVKEVKTVATQAYQLWLNKNLQEVGWTTFSDSGQEPVLTAFVEPVDTWAPLDQLLSVEDWNGFPTEPKNVSYFCGAMPVSDYPAFSDHSFPERMKQQVKGHAIDQLNQEMGELWPKAVTDSGFDWSVLFDAREQPGQGQARFDSQYWRANVDPSERYVQSVPGSTQYRLNTDGSGFDNLYLTGDWIKTGINAGCVEAAVQAGLLTSRAISGYPKSIKGLKDFKES